MAARGTPGPLPLAGLSAGVLLAHLAAVQAVMALTPRLGDGAGAEMQRIEVAFVRELAPAAPPVVVPRPAPAPPPAPRVARTAAPAASAARAAPPPAEPVLPAETSEPATAPKAEAPPAAETLAQAASVPVPASAPTTAPPSSDPDPAAAAPQAAPPDAAASAPLGPPAVATAFEWPPSTRLSYVLNGYYRGPVHGSAQVEWLRSGSRYQVHLDVTIGPLLSRRMSSEGQLGEDGLRPERYEEVTRALMRETRRQTVRFEPEQVVLAQGQAVPRPVQVQDTASQFVQLTWLFTTRAELLRAGQVVEVPLALPRRVDRWIYDIQAEETLDTPVGRLATFHMKPRRSVPRPGELVLESWFAPGLQYLPVRIMIRQDEETWIDLNLSQAPQQAAPEPLKAR